MSYSLGTTCLFGARKGNFSLDELKNIFGIKGYRTGRIQFSKYLEEPTQLIPDFRKSISQRQ